MKKDIQSWFDEYGESHQNPTNKLIHWICVPTIFFSIVCLLSLVPIYNWISLATLILGFAMLFYLRLSVSLAVGLFLFYLICLWGAEQLALAPIPLWISSVSLFALAWIGQFYGHHIEGKKPSFLKDLQFLLIGPAWLLGFVYKRLGIRY
ncbi:MAG: DUF962 domain-containing protein [Bacteroidia bacterium]|nr:DUF962 domain-containing protein [Bacteroidia bacterium]